MNIVVYTSFMWIEIEMLHHLNLRRIIRYIYFGEILYLYAQFVCHFIDPFCDYCIFRPTAYQYLKHRFHENTKNKLHKTRSVLKRFAPVNAALSVVPCRKLRPVRKINGVEYLYDEMSISVVPKQHVVHFMVSIKTVRHL